MSLEEVLRVGVQVFLICFKGYFQSLEFFFDSHCFRFYGGNDIKLGICLPEHILKEGHEGEVR